ncbi:MAG: CPBP family intramembrane metalloprotease, partial [Anaerolineales bacterium]
MNKEKVALVGYIAFIFVLMAVAMLFDVDEAAVYIQAALVAMGVAAVVLQKVVHRGRLLDMGFRPGRKAAIGMGVGLVFTAIMLALAYWLPQQLGFIDLTVNPDSPLVGEAVPLLATLVSLAISGGLMFVMALLTEELVHRGYILPKLEQFLGGPKAVVASAVLFGLWHIPAYYSVYAGGAEQQGLVSVLASAMLGSGLSVVPLCLLYLTTRELYGVSL